MLQSYCSWVGRSSVLRASGPEDLRGEADDAPLSVAARLPRTQMGRLDSPSLAFDRPPNPVRVTRTSQLGREHPPRTGKSIAWRAARFGGNVPARHENEARSSPVQAGYAQMIASSQMAGTDALFMQYLLTAPRAYRLICRRQRAAVHPVAVRHIIFKIGSTSLSRRSPCSLGTSRIVCGDARDWPT